MKKLPLLSLLLCALSAPLAAQACLLPPGPILLADDGRDFVLPAEPIGFPFPIGGQTYTDIHLSDHCFGALSNAGVPTPPFNGFATYTIDQQAFLGGGPRVAPFWADCVFGEGGSLTIDRLPNKFVATWTNMQTWSQIGPLFSVQMVLYPNGQVEFLYDAVVDNFAGSATATAIVGVTEGGYANPIPTVDMSVGGVSLGTTRHEVFVNPNTFDLRDSLLRLGAVAQSVTQTTQPGCAQSSQFGMGCGRAPSRVHEYFPAGSLDLSNTAWRLQRTASGYAMSTSSATLLTPSSSAAVVAGGQLDGEEQLFLPVSMPTPLGPVDSVVACTKGYVTLGATGVGPNFTPTEQDFLAWELPVVAGLWLDWDQTQSGSIVQEIVGGKLYVTWDDVQTYNHVPTGTMQMQFEFATGDIDVVYGQLPVVDPASPLDSLVGYQSGELGSSAVLDLTFFSGPLALLDDPLLQLDGPAPHLGYRWRLTTDNIDPLSPIAITFFGSLIQAPGGLPGVPLTSIGFDAPGCWLLIDNLVGSLSAPSLGSATVEIDVPSDLALIGSQLVGQSLCLTASNGANLLTSNALIGTVGF